MARKDVELIIRAKDEATKAVNAVTKAINNLADTQSGLQKSASQSDSALSKLGAAFKALDSQLSGRSPTAQIARQLDYATKAADRLEKSVASTADELADLNKRAEEAAKAQSDLAASATRAGDAVEREQAALRKAKDAVSAQSAALNKAVADRQRLIDADAKLTQQIGAQSVKVQQAAGHYQKLADEIAQVAQPSEKLQAALTKANSSVEKQEAALNDLRTTQGAVRNAIGQTEAAVQRFAVNLEQANAAVAKQQRTVASTASEYTELKAAAKSAAAEQRTLVDQADRVADSLAREKDALNRAQVEMGQLAVAAGKAGAATAEFATRARGPLLKAFGDVAKATAQVRSEWAQSEAAVKRLAGSLTQIGPPTREQAVAWQQATTAARAAKAEYLAQQQGLQRLRAILKETGGGVDEMRARFQRFDDIAAGTGAAIAKIRSEASQSVAAFQKLAGAAADAGNRMRGGGRSSMPEAGPVNSLAQAWRSVTGETRQALSWTQRIRGEVLSLVTAYGGLYAVTGLLDRTIKAYQTLEAAQSRLGAVFKQDQSKVGQELDFIRRNADRLGIEFGQLSDEYTKFAAATKGTNIEGEKTRKIFIKVAEAGRVNKLSFEDMQGVFKALTQIASKGKIQLEELTGQLGDRLPGALQIMADGLGVTTQELLKMTKEGQVSSSELVKFAAELDRRYGGQLAASLETTTTQMGRFSNAVFQSLASFGKAGFIESFTNLLKDMTATMKSADFQSFIGTLSKGFGLLADVVAGLARNFKLVVAAMAGFAGYKMVPVVLALVSSFQKLQKAIALGALFSAANAGMTGTAAAATTATVAVGRLTTALRLLTSGTGIGLVVTAVAAGIGYWASSADDATEALTRHQAIVDNVKNAYDATGGAADKWAKAISTGTITQAEANLTSLTKALDEWQRSMRNAITIGSPIEWMRNRELADARQQMNKLTIAFSEGKMSVEDYKAALDKIGQNTANEEVKALAASYLDATKRGDELKKATEEAAAVIQAIRDPTDEAAKAVLGLGQAQEEASAAADEGKARLEAYTESVNKLKEFIPELADELKKLKELAAIDEAYQGALKVARTIGEANQAYDLMKQARQNTSDKYTNFEAQYAAGRGTPQGAQMEELVRATVKLAEQMGVSAKDLLTVMSYETKGKLDPWMKGPETQWGTHRGLIQWGEPQAARYGVNANTSINDQVMAAGKYLTDAGVKAGDGLLQIYAAINAGNAKKIHASDANNGGASGTVLDKVSGQMEGHKARAEGLLAAYKGVTTEVEKQLEIGKKASEEAAKKKEKADEERATQAKDTETKIKDGEFAISQQELINQGKQREAEIEQAIREAKAANPNITAAEIEQIKQQTGALFDLKNIRTEDNAKKKEAEQLTQQANALLAQQTALQQQLKLAKESGDQSKYQEVQTELAGVNEKLTETIAKAREMWATVGGAAADTGLAKMDALGAKAETSGMKMAAAGQNSYLNWQQVGQLFASGLTNAFDKFAQAVANGEDVGEAAKNAFLQFAADFLRQIAQMIIQQAILNALRSFGGGGLFGGIGVGHTGGLVGSKRIGSGNMTRRVDPTVFAGAPRFHDGYSAGIKPGEIPAILQRNEEVLTRDDPRHILNGGLNPASPAPSAGGKTKIVNAIDSPSFLDAALASTVGEKIILNYIRANSSAVNAALQGG